MINKRQIFMLLAAFLFLISSAGAQIYVGAGADYFMPRTDFKKKADNFAGFNAQLEFRQYCKLWYGLRADYAKVTKSAELNITDDYYYSIFMLSPEVRYVFTGKDCYQNTLLPYVQAMLNFSGIGGTDNSNRFGIGASAGAGLAYGFTCWDKCWSIDLNGLYSAPNCIDRASNRPSLENILLSLSLSMRLGK